VFTFTHPNWQQPADNSRAISLTFQRPAEQGSGVLHGFAGYFESVLYGGEGVGRSVSQNMRQM
jgi:protein arginine N-methyltransferase 5